MHGTLRSMKYKFDVAFHRNIGIYGAMGHKKSFHIHFEIVYKDVLTSLPSSDVWSSESSLFNGVRSSKIPIKYLQNPFFKSYAAALYLNCIHLLHACLGYLKIFSQRKIIYFSRAKGKKNIIFLWGISLQISQTCMQ